MTTARHATRNTATSRSCLSPLHLCLIPHADQLQQPTTSSSVVSGASSKHANGVIEDSAAAGVAAELAVPLGGWRRMAIGDPLPASVAFSYTE